MAGTEGTIIIENAEIMYRNFAGKESDINPAGSRNFCVLLDDDLAAQLEHDGANVKSVKVHEPGDTPQKYLPVAIKFTNRDGSKARTPPQMGMITSAGLVVLDEDTVEVLDYVEIARVDVNIRLYEWNFQRKSGIKAVVKSLYLTVKEDELSQRYAALPKVDMSGRSLELTAGGSTEDIWDAEVVQEDTLELEA